MTNQRSKIRNRTCPAFSIVEMLIALAITSVLLTATMVAVDASFRAYAAAAQTASTHASTRMVTNRLLGLIRGSTSHGPTTLSEALAVDPDAVMNNGVIESNYLDMIDAGGYLIRVEYRAVAQELWYLRDEDGDFVIESTDTAQPMLGGVTRAVFHARPRVNLNNITVLERGSIDIEVEPDQDNTLAIETTNLPPIRFMASTMPRKVN